MYVSKNVNITIDQYERLSKLPRGKANEAIREGLALFFASQLSVKTDSQALSPTPAIHDAPTEPLPAPEKVA